MSTTKLPRCKTSIYGQRCEYVAGHARSHSYDDDLDAVAPGPETATETGFLAREWQEGTLTTVGGDVRHGFYRVESDPVYSEVISRKTSNGGRSHVCPINGAQSFVADDAELELAAPADEPPYPGDDLFTIELSRSTWGRIVSALTRQGHADADNGYAYTAASLFEQAVTIAEAGGYIEEQSDRDLVAWWTRQAARLIRDANAKGDEAYHAARGKLA